MGDDLYDLFLKYFKIKSEIKELPKNSIKRRRRKMEAYFTIQKELEEIIGYKPQPENNATINPHEMLDDFEGRLVDKVFIYLYNKYKTLNADSSKRRDIEKVLMHFMEYEKPDINPENKPEEYIKHFEHALNVAEYKARRYKELPEEELGPNGRPKKGGSRKTSHRNSHSKSRNIKERK